MPREQKIGLKKRHEGGRTQSEQEVLRAISSLFERGSVSTKEKLSTKGVKEG